MTKRTDGGPAFPGPYIDGEGYDQGMTVRQYYKAAALTGLLSPEVCSY